jgi:hypothetical protein
MIRLLSSVALVALAACATAPEDAAVLPADMAAAPGDLTFTYTPLVPGEMTTFTVTGAQPNTNMFLFRSNQVQPSGFCPGLIAPDCMDLAPPLINTFTLRSNAQGVASLTFPFPNLPPAVSTVAMQVGYITSTGVDTSNAVQATIYQPGSDTDGDGLTAADEVGIHGTDPGLADSDGGGLNDGDEVAAGGDPLDPSDDNPGGGALTIDDLAPGDLVVTEIMQNPDAVSDGDGEWFEIHNPTSSDIDLDGMLISDDGTNNHVVGSSVIIPAGGYVVFAINGDDVFNGGLGADYAWSGYTLSNGDDEVSLEHPTTGVVFDVVRYDGGPVWPDPTGASMQLDSGILDATGNDDGGNWCEADTAYTSGDLGTPGAPNTACPDNPTWDDDIYPLFLNTCTNCHVGGASLGQLNLDDYSSAVGPLANQAAGVPLVVPGDASGSYLFAKLIGTQVALGGSGSQMPLIGPLEPAEIGLVEAWINSGAAEN